MKNIKVLICTALVAVSFFACKKANDRVVPERLSSAQAASPAVAASAAGVTVLAAPIAEAKIYKLIKGYNKDDKFEASGVYYLNGYFYVASDNRFEIAKIRQTLPENSNENSLLGSGSGDSGFEGITYAAKSTPAFFVVEEAVEHGSRYQPRIREYNSNMVYQSSLWADYYFTEANSNKGFEGIAWVARGGDDYLLGLVEGTGKIAVLKKNNNQWQKVTEITLPSPASFTDYSELTVYGNRVAITSQQDSKLWVGTLNSTDWTITGGKTYEFPKGNSSGVVGSGNNVLYANIEGVSFISDTQIVVVSDKAKSDQPAYQKFKDQSVHVFNLPL